MKKMKRPRHILSALIVALLLHATAPCRAGDPACIEQIEQDIEYMLSGLGHYSVKMQPRIDAVVAHKDDAVPILIRQYEQTTDEECWPLVSSLCKLETPQALQFVRRVMQEHTKIFTTQSAIRIYPVAKEDDIIGILIELLNVDGSVHYDANERLMKAIERNPNRAGKLVATLQDDSELESTHIYDVLARMSGYSYTWCVGIPPGQVPIIYRNNFWRDWWTRNSEKDVFGWLEEAASSDNASRQATALQHMGSDERAIPYFIDGLDSPSESVQYWSVVGLRRIESSAPSGGYRSESFQLEKHHEIPRLKKKFASSSPENGISLEDLHALQYTSAMAGRDEKELTELLHRDVPEFIRKQLQALFTKYYPDVKYKYLDLNGVRFEYNVKREEYPLPRKGKYATGSDDIPCQDGILCRVSCRQGPYRGATAFVPKGDGQYHLRVITKTTHKIMIMVSYSKVLDVHLWVSLTYPLNTKEDFLRKFRQIVTDFENANVTNNANQ